jgi:hypothetical protein
LIHKYDIAFLKDDKAEMERAAARARGQSGAEDGIAYHEAFFLAYSGRLRQASMMLARAVDLAQHANQRETAALYETAGALWEAFFGNAAAAKERATTALKLSKDREVVYGAALALALSGASSQSQTLADDLEKRFGEDTSIRFSYLPAIRARLALNNGDASKALELLQAAIPYDLSTPRSSIHGNFGQLYTIYVRGEAFLAQRQGVEAVAEFQKFPDHRGIVVMDPTGALAHLQLGRAFALSGDKAKAKVAYEAFLKLWKEADADLPILKQAKAEYVGI